MSKYVESAAELIGKTPLLKLNGYTKKAGVTNANIFAICTISKALVRKEM